MSRQLYSPTQKSAADSHVVKAESDERQLPSSWPPSSPTSWPEPGGGRERTPTPDPPRPYDPPDRDDRKSELPGIERRPPRGIPSDE